METKARKPNPFASPPGGARLLAVIGTSAASLTLGISATAVVLTGSADPASWRIAYMHAAACRNSCPASPSPADPNAAYISELRQMTADKEKAVSQMTVSESPAPQEVVEAPRPVAAPPPPPPPPQSPAWTGGDDQPGGDD